MLNGTIKSGVLLLFVFYLASVHFLSSRFNAPGLIDRFNVAPLLNAPVETITQGLLLRYKPLNLDVLPLYIVLMLFLPLISIVSHSATTRWQPSEPLTSTSSRMRASAAGSESRVRVASAPPAARPM